MLCRPTQLHIKGWLLLEPVIQHPLNLTCQLLLGPMCLMSAWWVAVVQQMTSTGASSMVCGASSWLWVSCGPVSRSDRPGLGSTSKAGPEASWLTTVSLCLLSSGALWVTASTVAHPVEYLAAPGSQTLGMRRPTGQLLGYACRSWPDSASHMCTWGHQHEILQLLSVHVTSAACLKNTTVTAHGLSSP